MLHHRPWLPEPSGTRPSTPGSGREPGPQLATGVFVHFHDIFLPYEYPIEFFTELGFSWAEQYLLQAFLAFNREFEVLFGSAALKRESPDAISELVPSATAASRPAAFWLRRVQPPSA